MARSKPSSTGLTERSIKAISMLMPGLTGLKLA
jgi:hypothetical protein